VLPLHKKYREYDLVDKGRVESLEDVRERVTLHWPSAREEGSAGLARMYTNPSKEFVAYAWGTVKREDRRVVWNYLVFREGHDW